MQIVKINKPWEGLAAWEQRIKMETVILNKLKICFLLIMLIF